MSLLLEIKYEMPQHKSQQNLIKLTITISSAVIHSATASNVLLLKDTFTVGTIDDAASQCILKQYIYILFLSYKYMCIFP